MRTDLAAAASALITESLSLWLEAGLGLHLWRCRRHAAWLLTQPRDLAARLWIKQHGLLLTVEADGPGQPYSQPAPLWRVDLCIPGSLEPLQEFLRGWAEDV